VDFLAGEILIIDKPLHWTSFDIVNKIRWHLSKALHIKKIKVGHAGTLDPLATGVVIVATGKKTKLIDELQAGVKEYVAEIQLGATTPSFDLETAVDATYPTEHITQELISTVLPRFIGEIWQVPPTYSAVKVDGKRAYEYARQGAEVKLNAKLLRIDELQLLNFNLHDKTLQLRIVCSKGTYIRAFARDLGEALDSGAHLTALRRTQVGEYRAENAMTMQQVIELIDNMNNSNFQISD